MGSTKIKDRLFLLSESGVLFYGQDHAKRTDSKALLFILPLQTRSGVNLVETSMYSRTHAQVRCPFVLKTAKQKRKSVFDVQHKNSGGVETECELQPCIHLMARLIKPGGKKAPFVL